MTGTLRFIRRHFVAGITHWRVSRQWRKFIKDHPLEADQIGLIIREGIGDHFAVAAFAEAIAVRHHCRIRLCGNPRYSFIKDLFPAVSDYLPRLVPTAFDSVADRKIELGNYSLAFFAADYSLARALGHGGFHMLDGYRCHLDLPGNTPPSVPVPPTKSELEKASRHLAGHGLPPGKTVILCIDARSISTAIIPVSFWLQLAKGLEAMGLTPAVNRGPATPELPGVRMLDIKLEQFRAIASAAGGVCAVRSGIVELAADLPALRVVLYPRIKHGGADLIDGFKLSRFGYPNTVQELSIADDAIEHLPSILNAFR